MLVKATMRNYYFVYSQIYTGTSDPRVVMFLKLKNLPILSSLLCCFHTFLLYIYVYFLRNFEFLKTEETYYGEIEIKISILNFNKAEKP